MIAPAKRAAKAILPPSAIDRARSAYFGLGANLSVLSGLALRPAHWLSARSARKQQAKFVPPIKDPMDTMHRVFEYDKQLLPNPFLAELESNTTDRESARKYTGLSIGYPAWGLLYYSLLASLPRVDREIVVLETGTNHGASTIVIAQALKDAGVRGRVTTVDIDPTVVEIARSNLESAGLSKYVEFNVSDSLEHVRKVSRREAYIDFAFLDGCHGFRHVLREFALIYPHLVACDGKAYFDNTISDNRVTGGVSTALRYIKASYGGNVIEFTNCSGGPPGNAIWQQG